MVDNWSASPVVLTDAGDWAKWSITLSSTDATDLNNLGNDFLNDVSIRMAMSAASRNGHLALIVNDNVCPGRAGHRAMSSSSAWVSANRFKFSSGLFGPVIGAELIDFPTGVGPSVNVSPWVAGTNTIRVLWFGRDSDQAAEPIEIDFLSIQTDPAETGPYVQSSWYGGGPLFGDDDTAETKPVTGGSIIGYDDHADPDAITTGGPATWILDNSAATVGTASESLLRIVKFCPPIATVKVTGAGDPVAGIVGFDQGGVVDTATLSGNGTARFTVPGGAPDANFWFGGNDDWAPAHVNVDGSDRFGCNGWHVGRVGVG